MRPKSHDPTAASTHGLNGYRKSDEVDGAIGELSQFHQTNSYYAQGVDLTTAKVPEGWESRLIPFQPSSADPARAMCLEKHDLVISKLVAMREKDQEFAAALLEVGLVDIHVLLNRVDDLKSVSPAVAKNVRRWLETARARIESKGSKPDGEG